MIKKVLGILGLMMITSSLSAAPSLNGPIGLISIPTAESLEYREVNLGYDYLGHSDPVNDTWSYKVNMGTFQHWEMGVVGGKTPTEGVFINVKYYLTAEDTRFPLSIAVGMENLASVDDSTIYMVASKKLQHGISAHMGFRALFKDKVIPTMMGGLGYMVNERFELYGDVSGDDKAYSANAGLRLYLTPTLILQGYATDVTEVTSKGRFYGAGISYSKFL